MRIRDQNRQYHERPALNSSAAAEMKKASNSIELTVTRTSTGLDDQVSFSLRGVRNAREGIPTPRRIRYVKPKEAIAAEQLWPLF